jgi:hypothetical protein
MKNWCRPSGQLCEAAPSSDAYMCGLWCLNSKSHAKLMHYQSQCFISPSMYLTVLAAHVHNLSRPALLALTPLLHVCMQAHWAASWLRQHAHMESLQPGWTYLFEAVGPCTAQTVQYNFEGLVLLAAVAPDGRERPAGSAALAQLGAQLGGMVVPCLEGPWGELLSRLPTHRAGGPVAATPTGPAGARLQQCNSPTSEGWVLQAADGMRTRLVSAEYTWAESAVAHMHPLTVWDRVRCGGWSHKELMASVPARFRGEMQGILDALDHGFCFVQQELNLQRQQLTRGATSARKGRLLELLGCLAAGHVEGRAEKVAQVRAMLADGGALLPAPAAAPGAAGRKTAPGKCNTPARGGARANRPPAAPVHHGTPIAGSSRGASARDPCSRKAALYDSPAFHAALQYLLQRGVKGSADVPSMYLKLSRSRKQHSPSAIAARRRHTACTTGPAPPLLRSMILDCLRPGSDGTLPGYASSPGVAQSHARAWRERGPVDERMGLATSEEPAVMSMLRDADVVDAILRLEGRELVGAQLVCKAWQRLLLGDQRYVAQVQLERQREEPEEEDADYWYVDHGQWHDYGNELDDNSD